jgi:uncharacterized protein YegJ (DUF2314 family)
MRPAVQAIASCMSEPTSEPEPESDDSSDDPWELPEPNPSGWVVFWPHTEAPTRDEIGTAFAAWLGHELEGDSPEEPEDGTLWAFTFNMEELPVPALVWAEPAQSLEGEEVDDAVKRCRWVVRVQAMLPFENPHEAYFRLVALMAGAIGDAPGLLDAITGHFLPRSVLESGFLAPEALPHERWLWRVSGAGLASPTDGGEHPTMLFTAGLWRCGRPEIELLELPATHVRAGLILLDAMAGLLLEGEMPPAGEVFEVGPGLNVTLQPWQEVAATIEEGVPGSKAFRAAAASTGGQSPLLGVRAVICHPEPVGAFRKVWTWPKDAVMAIESGQAALYATEHATKASLRRAQRRWETFATAFASLKKAEGEAAVDVREHGFTVQAPLEGGNDPDRVEQAWFCVKRFDAGQVEGALLEKPRSRDDLEAGSVLRIDPTTISDWRVEMPEGDFGPERWQDILPAVDRLRGL